MIIERGFGWGLGNSWALGIGNENYHLRTIDWDIGEFKPLKVVVKATKYITVMGNYIELDQWRINCNNINVNL